MKIFVRDMNNLPVFRKLWEVCPNIIFGIDSRFEEYRVRSRQLRLECNSFTNESARDEFYLYAMQKLFPGSSKCYLATLVVLENAFLRYEVMADHTVVKREKAVTLMKEYYHGYEIPFTCQHAELLQKIVVAL